MGGCGNRLSTARISYSGRGLGEPPPAQPVGIPGLSRGPTAPAPGRARLCPRRHSRRSGPRRQLPAARPGVPARPLRPSKVRARAAPAAPPPPPPPLPQHSKGRSAVSFLAFLPPQRSPSAPSAPAGRRGRGPAPWSAHSSAARATQRSAAAPGPRVAGRATPARRRPRPAPRPGVPGRAPGLGRTMRRRGRSGGGKRRRR